MLGFRSNKLWKKILSVAYLVIMSIVFIVGIETYTSHRYKVTIYDHIINLIVDLLIFIIFLTPYIFLSNTKFRQKLPLFNKNKKRYSILGLVIVNIALCTISSVFDATLHSEEYLADMANHDYQITKQQEADCENNGFINRKCDYCGKVNNETILALGHSMKETSKTGASCEEKGILTEKCERCGYTADTELDVLGHSMKETRKKDATCENDGYVVKKCERCDYTEEETLKALGHNMKEITNKEPTCYDYGYYKKVCERCGYTDEDSLPMIVEEFEEISRTEPTLTQDGSIVYKCKFCGREYTETLRKLGLTEEEYMAECSSYDYETISRYPNDYIGQKAVFLGKVVQVQESGNRMVIRLNVTAGEYGMWKDTIYIDYTKSSDDPRILEDDIISVFGELNGIKTYTSTMDVSISIPHIKAKYIYLGSL